MRKHVLIFSLFAFLVGFSASAINFSRVNVAWQYDVNFGVKMAHRVVSDEGELIIFLRVSADSIDSWTYEFLLQNGYESETHQIIQPIATDTLLDVSSQRLLRIRLSKTDENLLVVKFSKPEQFYFYDIRLRIGSLSFPSIYPVDEQGIPILEKFINRSGHKWIGNDTLIAMQYAENFVPADPPMADMKPLAPQVDMDTAFVISDTPAFKENYFYTVRKDSLSTVGVTMLRVPPYYPEYRQLRELIESMLYLTSEQEKKAILRSKTPKQSFDSFWMNTFSTKSRARNAIRKYYNWIENANKLFTDFKPGWKTDRGMMYIVFGKPDEVYRTGSLEEWYYDDGSAFEFTIISTFFAPQTYSLRRDIEFEEQWYTQIAAIRRGIK
ncbi:GWxTD domain-containing protein [Ekhidna sp.]|uniref:GWxTD domain-containing protein n=1 Tax=Ekhidna sp. TaxID=2608089 RepID=UPI003C7BA53A